MKSSCTITCTTFFARYYDAGDFIPKRRRSFARDGRDTYAIPWDGEEINFHWANRDQYHIKSSERFFHYRWKATSGEEQFTVEFQLTDANLPANNNQHEAKKYYLPLVDDISWDGSAFTLRVPFNYRALSESEAHEINARQEAKIREKANLRTIRQVLESPHVVSVPHLKAALLSPVRLDNGNAVPNREGEPVSALAHQIDRWTVKNEADYFIHKDLGRIITGELDYFIKSSVLNLDNYLAAGEARTESTFRLLEALRAAFVKRGDTVERRDP